jgi:hypothetical protein
MQIAKTESTNAESPRHESAEGDSKFTVERDRHSRKHSLQSVSTDEGMQNDESDEHLENAEGAIDETFEGDSNVTVERDRHPRKQDSESFSTDEGIQIDKSDQQPVNAVFPINES